MIKIEKILDYTLIIVFMTQIYAFKDNNEVFSLIMKEFESNDNIYCKIDNENKQHYNIIKHNNKIYYHDRFVSKCEECKEIPIFMKKFNIEFLSKIDKPYVITCLFTNTDLIRFLIVSGNFKTHGNCTTEIINHCNSK